METRILVGIPCLDVIKTPTVASIFSATAMLEYPAKLHIQTSCYIHDARNKIVSGAIEKGFSHIMFIDSDMQFPPDSINRLVKDDKDVIGGVYFRRQIPHLPTINSLENDKIVVPYKFPKDKPFQIWSIATGFMLIKIEVVKKIPYPWFGFGSYKGQYMGEDVYFCRKVNDHKFEVWADPTIELLHVGEYAYGVRDYDAYQDIRKKENIPDEFDGVIK